MNLDLLKKEYTKFKTSNSNQFLLLYSSFEEQIVFISKICKESEGQTLITCSSLSEIKIIFKILSKYIAKEEIEIIHKNYFKNELLNRNKKINSEKIKIIISTKTGIFSPFFNLKNIIIINEESKDHKQYDLNPRYNIKDICFYLSKKNKKNLILTSQSPSIETYYKNLEILFLKEKNITTTTSLVDQKTERRSKNELYISLQLQEKIEEILQKNKKIIIINNDLKSEFKSNQKIKEEISALFKTTITTVDSKAEINFDELKNSKIIIGTEFFVKNYLYEIKSIGLIALLSLDNFINSINIKANEDLFAYITFFINLSKEKSIENLLIQAKNIENETLNKALNQDYKTFFDKEIEIRKILEYPPFSTIIDLIIKEKTAELLQIKKNKIIDILDKNNIETIGEKTIEKELKTKIRKQENISIKTKSLLSKEDKTILNELSQYCLIDIK
ncbi:MAG: hypothetical protein QMB51_03865 [Patescibacteria group bacterium]